MTTSATPFGASQRELLQRLHEHPPTLPGGVLAVLDRFEQAGEEAWLAGGCVRDLVLGRPPADFDIATRARPERVLQLFARVIPTGLQHGTVTVLVRDPEAPADAPERHVEVTTFRGEGAYLDGRRPERVEFIDDLEQDLARRDFTINAMAYRPGTGELRDPFGGAGDLARRRVRAVGDPVARFSEDGLRPLRAVRFASVLSFGLEGATRAAIPRTISTFRRVAAERVREELVRLLLRSPRPSRGLRLLEETGLLAETVPELLEGRGLRQNRWHRWTVWEHVLRAVDHTPPRLVVRLAALLHDVAKPRCAQEVSPGEHTFYQHEHVGARLARDVLERLRFPGKVIDEVSHLVREHNWFYSPEWNDGTVRRHLARLGVAALPDFFDLREADLRARGRALRAGLENLEELRARFERELARASALTIKDLAIGGADVMAARGLGPGPQVGATLRAALQHVLDHPEDNEREKLLDLVRSGALSPPG